jgi:hypothetical protein
MKADKRGKRRRQEGEYESESENRSVGEGMKVAKRVNRGIGESEKRNTIG